MPRSKKKYTLTHQGGAKKAWILYSSNREFCFLDELRLGYFGPNYRCGCAKCDAQLILPKPSFTPRLDESRTDRQENSK